MLELYSNNNANIKISINNYFMTMSRQLQHGITRINFLSDEKQFHFMSECLLPKLFCNVRSESDWTINTEKQQFVCFGLN